MKFQVAVVAAVYAIAYDETTMCPFSEFLKLAPLTASEDLSVC